MNLITAVYNRLHPEVDTRPIPLSTPGTRQQAQDAAVDAVETLEKITSNRENVFQKVYAMKEQGHRNGFAKLIEDTMRGNG